MSVVVLSLVLLDMVVLDVVVLDVVVLSLVLRSVGAGPPPHLRNVVSPAPTARTDAHHLAQHTARTFSIHTVRNIVSPAPTFPHTQ